MTSIAAGRVSVRHPRQRRVSALGVGLIALWIALGLLMLWALIQSLGGERLASYGPRLVSGFVTTVELVALSVVLGAAISIPIAAGRLSKARLFSTLAYGYSYFFRGTPLIAQLFLIYYGAGEFAGPLKAAGLWWLFRDAFNCAVLSFALNTGAYQSEILSGSIRNIPQGQREAAAALGLHRWVILWKIVLPQALVVALRPYGNEVVLMIKASAVAAIVTVLDLMGQTRFIFSKTYDLSFYLWAAVFYLVLVELLGRVINAIERRITRHHIR